MYFCIHNMNGEYSGIILKWVCNVHRYALMLKLLSCGGLRYFYSMYFYTLLYFFQYILEYIISLSTKSQNHNLGYYFKKIKNVIVSQSFNLHVYVADRNTSHSASIHTRLQLQIMLIES